MTAKTKTVRLAQAVSRSIECKLSVEAHCVYLLLVYASEGEDIERNGHRWRDVYLDNARPDTMNDKQFRAFLAVLSKTSLYEPLDGYAFGQVRFT